ncbi:MAG: hypothetical protein JRF15_14840 [Deltaproteobacteria bacterium]|jgi:hypothetical protein|nr:hypothetical protein [Deltaproteobacteria bacterium]
MSNVKKCSSQFHDPVVSAYRAHIDRTLIQKNLKLSVEERFLQLMELQRLAVELRDAGRRASER